MINNRTHVTPALYLRPIYNISYTTTWLTLNCENDLKPI